MKLREAFPNGRFGSPVTAAYIQQAEALLRIKLPAPLREAYLECDGFREPLGNAKYLLSLLEEDFIGSLVTITKFYWQDYWDLTGMDLRPFVFFGSSSCDHAWGMRIGAPHSIIAYHHSMEDSFEEAGEGLIEVYLKDHALCREVARQ
jgi:hypothetical protein